MKKNKIIFSLLLLVCVSSLPLAYSQEAQPVKQPPTISVVGRLALEKHGQEEWLVLHAEDAKTYLLKVITPDSSQKAKDLISAILLELGDDVLVSVTGYQGGTSRVSCQRSSNYEYNEEGKRELKVETRCIRYYNLELTQILPAKDSNLVIPPPERDIEEERRAKRYMGSQAMPPAIIGEIYGKVSSINLKSPIKTVEIENRDKISQLKKIILIISPDTRIVKKIGGQEPMALSPNALETDQEITVVYSRDEFKTEALFITITK